MYLRMCQAIYGHSQLIRLMLGRDQVLTFFHEEKCYTIKPRCLPDLYTHKNLHKYPHVKCKGVYGFQGDLNRVALKVSLHCELPGGCIVLSKCSSLVHTSLEVHCSYRLKFFVAKNHPRSSSPFLTAVFLAVVLLNTFNTSFSRV